LGKQEKVTGAQGCAT